MRIVLAGPPKTGNVWLKCLLADIYGLRPLPPKSVPLEGNTVKKQRVTPSAFVDWANSGKFDDGSIFHQHYQFSEEICDVAEALPAHIITIVRDPYDAFVSAYFTMQQYQPDDLRRGPLQASLIGKPIDHPDVLKFLEQGGMSRNVQMAHDWLRSGRSKIVRYENLQRDPEGELRRLTDEVESAPLPQIVAAIESCKADTMRQKSAATAKHVRTARVGDSREHLTEAHLAIIRERYGDLIRDIGYDVL